METTYRSLGSLLLGLLSDPAQLEAIRADRSLIPQAIEEGVRWEPPLLTITRVATRDTELGGVAIPAGATVMPMLGSANRQEDRYPDPDTFNIHRQAKSNLGWGYGVHVCLGMHLARLEMRTAINLLLDRLPNLTARPRGRRPARPRPGVPVADLGAGAVRSAVDRRYRLYIGRRSRNVLAERLLISVQEGRGD